MKKPAMEDFIGRFGVNLVEIGSSAFEGSATGAAHCLSLRGQNGFLVQYTTYDIRYTTYEPCGISNN